MSCVNLAKRLAHSISAVSLGFVVGEGNSQACSALFFADDDKALLAAPEERSGLRAEGLTSYVRKGGSKLRRNLQSESCHASAFGNSFVCDRQIVSRTLPRCAPTSESPYAA